MESRFEKFLRLFGMLFLSLIGGIVFVALLMMLVRLMFGVLDSMSWFSYFYLSAMLLLPSLFFITVFGYYFKRTKAHPSVVARWISYVIFTTAILTWITVLVMDTLSLMHTGSPEITKYNSYNLLLLTGNIGLIFFVGVLQALTTEKEKDWMEKHAEKK